MKKENALLLLKKYNEGIATDKEKALLETWYLEWNNDDVELSAKEIADAERIMFSRFPKPKYRYKIYKYAAAALILVSISTTLYFLNFKSNTITVSNNKSIVNDVAPGKNIAMLTLANGKVIKLNQNEAGVVINSNHIAYTDGTEITNNNPIGELLIASTPKGGKYQITLPDGTKVWLNAASSLKFPSKFANNKREVELDGEAYFEVAKLMIGNEKMQQRMPFIVTTHNQKVEVFGTHFNINSYTDEQFTNTTLLEGSVKVSPLDNSKNRFKAQFLKPNQETILNNNAVNQISVQQANINKVMAWKNGYFNFENDDLQTVMRKIMRWYNVEVIYKVNRFDDQFVGDISQNVNLSEVIKILEYGGVGFKIEGNKLIVIK